MLCSMMQIKGSIIKADEVWKYFRCLKIVFTCMSSLRGILGQLPYLMAVHDVNIQPIYQHLQAICKGVLELSTEEIQCPLKKEQASNQCRHKSVITNLIVRINSHNIQWSVIYAYITWSTHSYDKSQRPILKYLMCGKSCIVKNIMVSMDRVILCM